MIIFNPEKSKKFEINILVKDHFGNPTNVRKHFSTDSAEELYSYWSRNNGHVKKKSRKDSGAATIKEVEKAVKEASTYADDLQKRRDNE